MVTILDRLDRLAAMELTDMEAHGILGRIAALAPEILDEALDRIEAQRAEAEARRRAAA